MSITRNARPFRLNRRALLRGAGGAALALPFLDVMRPRTVKAQTAEAPRRVIFVFQANGDQVSQRFVDVVDPQNFGLGEFLAPLQDYKSELLFLNRLDKKYGELPSGQRADNHEQGGSALAPWPSGSGDYPIGGTEDFIGHVLGPSADYHLGQRVLDANPGVAHRHLVYRVGDNYNNIWNLHAHAGPVGTQNPVPPETDPYAAYARIFSFAPEDEVEQAALRKRISKRQSALDLVLAEATSLHAKLGTANRAKLQMHMDSLRDIERTLVVNEPGAACAPLDLGGELDPYDADNHEIIGELFLRISTMAFACDLTRSIQFNWSGNTSGRVYRNLVVDGSPIDEGHHDITHVSDAAAFAKVRAIQRHLWQQNTKLYEMLKTTPDGDGMLWDHTLVMHWNELAQGDSHAINDQLVVLAGGAHGYFRPGRLVDYDNGGAFSDALLHAFHYMGFTDMSVFGDERLSNGGPLSGVT